MIFTIKTQSDIEKPMSYAKRLLETAKFGIKISVEKKRNPRTSKENRYYWGIIVKMISDATGYFPLEVHEILKQEFLRLEDKIINGKRYIITKSTAKLNTAEAEEYYEKCRMYASINIEICIPLPNEISSSWK